MRQLKTILAPLLIACLVALLAAVPAFAIPPPPSIFHGTIRVNGANVPDGLLILALINGEYCALGYTWTDQGNSTYSLEVPGDDPGTPEREGGREGDTVQFELGGVLADQAGTWHSGMSVQLDLTLLADGVPPTLMPTISPDSVPAQTSGPAVQPSPTVSPTPQPTLQPMPAPTLTPTALRQPSPTPTRTPTPSVPPSPTSTALATPTWTLTPTRQPSQASLPSPAPTRTIVPTGPPSPTMTSSPSPRGTPVLSAQSPPAITPSATAVQTIEPAGQPPVTSVSLPTAARTAIPPAQPGPKPIVRLSSETNDSGARLEGIWLMAAALVIALVTCLVIAVGVVIGYIRQPR